MITARSRFQHAGDRIGFEPEIEEPGTRDLGRFAPVADIQLGQRTRGEFAWVEPPGLGKTHERVGLIITEAGVRTRLNQDRGEVRVRQDLSDDLLESLFEGQVQHVWKGKVRTVGGASEADGYRG